MLDPDDARRPVELRWLPEVLAACDLEFGQQQDAAELLSKWVDLTETHARAAADAAAAAAVAAPPQGPIELPATADGNAPLVAPPPPPLLIDELCGTYASTLTCSSCGHVSPTNAPFRLLSLEIAGLTRVRDCIGHHAGEETLPDVECGGCHNRTTQTKRLGYAAGPPCLAVHLKRFSHAGDNGVGVKDEHHVTFGNTITFPLSSRAAGEAPRELLYRLRGVVRHDGQSLAGGHYIAYVKGQPLGVDGPEAWFEISDSNAREVSANNVFATQAYMLFYEREAALPVAQQPPNQPAPEQPWPARGRSRGSRTLAPSPRLDLAPSFSDVPQHRGEQLKIAASVHPACPPTVSDAHPTGRRLTRRTASAAVDATVASVRTHERPLRDTAAVHDWVGADEAPLRELPEVAGSSVPALPRLTELFVPMDPRDIARLEAAVAVGNDDDLLTTTAIGGIKLRRTDTRTLLPGAWLNDEIMNVYFALLSRRHAGFIALREKTRLAHIGAQQPGPPPPRLRPVHIFSSFFWLKLNQDAGGCNVQGGTYTYANVSRWTGVPGKPLKVDIFACSHVIVPVNVVRTHWSLGVIFPQQRAIATPDSIGSGDDRVFELLLQYVKDEHINKHGVPLPDADKWHRVCQPWPQQTNGCDCGAFSLLNADLLLLGEALNYGQGAIGLFRRKVLLACLNGSLSHDATAEAADDEDRGDEGHEPDEKSMHTGVELLDSSCEDDEKAPVPEDGPPAWANPSDPRSSYLFHPRLDAQTLHDAESVLLPRARGSRTGRPWGGWREGKVIALPEPGVYCTAGGAQCLWDGEWLNDEVINTLLRIENISLARRAAAAAAAAAAAVAPPAASRAAGDDGRAMSDCEPSSRGAAAAGCSARAPRLHATGAPNGAPRRVFIWDSLFLARMLQGGRIDMDVYDYNLVKAWATRRGLNVLDVDWIIVPIHLSSHWALAVLDLKSKEVHYYDSLAAGAGNKSVERIEHLLHWLSDESAARGGEAARLDIADFKVIMYKDDQVPQQTNGIDCGVFMVSFALAIARGEIFRFSQADIPVIRRRFAADLATCNARMAAAKAASSNY